MQLPKLNHNLCFTVDGRANDVLRLLEDPERGMSEGRDTSKQVSLAYWFEVLLTLPDGWYSQM